MTCSTAALWGSKAAAGFLFVIAGAVGAAIPYSLNRCKVATDFSYLNAFAGGAFLALGVLHILPEAAELLEEQRVFIYLNGQPLAVTYLLIFVGYISILFCERILSGTDCNEDNICKTQHGMFIENELQQVPAPAKTSCHSKSTNSASDDVEAACPIEDDTSDEMLALEDEEKQYRPRFHSAAFFMMLAMAIHGLFEGVIVGASNDLSMIWVTTSVILGHKWAESLLLMCHIVERKLDMLTVLLLIITFIISSPIGVVLGAILAAEGKLASGICNALGAGTVLYIAGEISSSAFNGARRRRLLQFISYCGGAALVLCLTLLDLAYGKA